MDNLPKGWYSEVSSFWPGQAQSLEVEEVLFEAKSDFQDVKVYKTKAWGTIFTLDGAIQVTDKDECSYHENIAHIPLFSHPNPKKVLIIGGGDGGAMREVLKHDCVEHVTLCDIDKMVPEISKKFFPGCAVAFEDPRAELVIGDGFAYMEDKKDLYDVIIVDSSDPDGPASTLFGEAFFTRCKDALKADGTLVTQAENMWIHLDLITSMKKFIETIGWASVEYANIGIPSYPSGCIGFFICSKKGSCKKMVRSIPDTVLSGLKYYDEDMHQSAFLVPRFVKAALGI